MSTTRCSLILISVDCEDRVLDQARKLCVLQTLNTVGPLWCWGGYSVDDQVAKDILLVDAIAEKQSQVFSDECKLFPADVQIMSNTPVYACGSSFNLVF